MYNMGDNNFVIDISEDIEQIKDIAS